MITSRCWNFVLKSAPPDSPFIFQKKCSFLEWDYSLGIVYGYIQFKTPQSPLPSSYTSYWKPVDIKYSTPLQIPMTYHYGVPVRPPFNIPFPNVSDYQWAVTDWRKRLKVIRRANKHDSHYRRFNPHFVDVIPEIVVGDLSFHMGLTPVAELTTIPVGESHVNISLSALSEDQVSQLSDELISLLDNIC